MPLLLVKVAQSFQPLDNRCLVFERSIVKAMPGTMCPQVGLYGKLLLELKLADPEVAVTILCRLSDELPTIGQHDAPVEELWRCPDLEDQSLAHVEAAFRWQFVEQAVYIGIDYFIDSAMICESAMESAIPHLGICNQRHAGYKVPQAITMLVDSPAIRASLPETLTMV